MRTETTHLIRPLTFALLLLGPYFLFTTPTVAASGITITTTDISQGSTANEGVIAVDPTNANNLAAFFQGSESCPSTPCQHTRYSTNGGSSWASSADVGGGYDPYLSYDASGNLYRLWAGNRIDKSTDHGATWTTFTVATSDGKVQMPDSSRLAPCAGGTGWDFSKMTIDTGANSLQKNWVYVWPANAGFAFNYGGTCHPMITLWISTDGGVTWNAKAWDAGHGAGSTEIAFAQSGLAVEAIYNETADGCGTSGGIEIYMFFPTQNPLQPPYAICAFTFSGTPLSFGGAGRPFFLLDPTNNNNVALGFIANTGSSGGLYIVHSTDGAFTFKASSLTRADEPGSIYAGGRGINGGIQMMPQWSISTNGRIDVAWYDDHGSPRNVYYRYSVDHGATFGPLTLVTANADSADYFSLASSGTKAYVYYPKAGAKVTTLDVTPPVSSAIACFTSTIAFNFTVNVDPSCSSASVTSWAWDWGDGSPLATTASASHTYSKAWPYAITLQVTETTGVANTTFRLASPPVSGQSACFTPTTHNLTVAVDPSCSSSSFTNWLWDWGDGSPATRSVTPYHPYRTPGTYRVTLWEMDAAGAANTTSAQVMVALPSDPNASIPTLSNGGVAVFDISSSTGVVWNYTKILMPAGRFALNASLTSAPPSGTYVQIYIKRGAPPNGSNGYDCSAGYQTGCNLTNPAEDWYYIGYQTIAGAPPPWPQSIFVTQLNYYAWW